MVQRIYEDLGDYERGALGDVQYLPGNYLDYLRIAEGAKAAMKAEQEKQLLERDD